MFLVFFATTLSSLGQSSKERQIEILASASIDGTEYNIKITTNTDSTKVKFKIRDSVSAKLYNDKEYYAHINYLLSLNNIDLSNDTVLNYLNILESIAEKYTFFSEDSIEIANSENEGYLNLINEVLKSPTDSLDNKILNKNRIVLDGIYMTFTFIDKDTKRKVSARTPTVKSHRLLYELVTSSTSIYRDTKKNDFLNKRRLFGY